MSCCNKKSKYSLNQLTEIVDVIKINNYNNQYSDYSLKSTVKATLFALIETKEPVISTYDGMIDTKAITHKIITRWTPSLFLGVANDNRINTGDEIVIKKSGERVVISSIYNENSANLYAIINCSNKGDSANIYNQSNDTVL